MTSRDYDEVAIYTIGQGRKSVASAKEAPLFNNPPKGTPRPSSQPAQAASTAPQSQGNSQGDQS